MVAEGQSGGPLSCWHRGRPAWTGQRFPGSPSGGESREQLWGLIRKLNREENVTIILVSHDMEDVYEMSERVLFMDRGTIVYDGGTEGFFEDRGLLEQYGITIPDGVKLLRDICLDDQNRRF